MSRLTIALVYATALSLSTLADAQSRLTIRIEGEVAELASTPPSGPFSSVVVGDPFVARFDALIPGVPTGFGTLWNYHIVPGSIRVQAGSASDIGDPSGIAEIDLAPQSCRVLAEMNSSFFDLFSLGSQTAFPSSDLEELVGVIPGDEIPLFLSFVVDDSGGSFLFSIDRMIIGAGVSYCGPSVPNSSGGSARIAGLGSTDTGANDLVLRATELPTQATSYFLVSDVQSIVVGPGGSSGNLCLGGSIGRFIGPGQILNSGVEGRVDLPIDLTSIPSPSGFVAVAPGETWNFQCWFRDSVGGVATSNFTDALSVTFE
ncbi:MAG: hypothetical protein AAGB93_01155 [Planctomycetota bacterium]